MLDDPEYNRTFVTKDNWEDYSSPLQSTFAFLEYIKASRHIVELLGAVLVKSDTFEELKNELTSLYNERKEFVDFADNNYPEITLE